MKWFLYDKELPHERVNLQFFRHQNKPQEVFYKKAALENFAVFRGKHLCQRIFLIKLQAFRYATLLKRDCNTDVLL